MYGQKTLVELATELQRIGESKKDFMARSDVIRVGLMERDAVADRVAFLGAEELKDSFRPDIARKSALEGRADVAVAMDLEEGEAIFPISQLAHEQVSGFTGINLNYYRKMLAEAPDLLAINAQHWLSELKKGRMVRTLDGKMRAFLSDRYRPLENIDLAEVVLPILQEDPRIQVVSCDVTDRRLYIKATSPRLQGEVRVGDIVQTGICVSNSEVGCGAVDIQPLVLRLGCLNGMVANIAGMKRRHVGGRREVLNIELAEECLTDETRAADDKAFWLKVRDMVKGVLTDENVFNVLLDQMKGAAAEGITGDIVKVVEVGAKRFGLTEGERGGVLRHLISEGDLTRYGFLNAITRESQDAKNYERATEMEKMGFQVLQLPKREWEGIAQAA
jgi:hypothetical protein